MCKISLNSHLWFAEQIYLDNIYVSILLPGKFEYSRKGLFSEVAMPGVRKVAAAFTEGYTVTVGCVADYLPFGCLLGRC